MIKVPWHNSKLDLAIKSVAFMIVVVMIVAVFVPYRERLERAARPDVSLAAETNTNLQGNE